MSVRVFRMKYILLVFLMLSIGCVSVDPQTGEALPRGDQKYTFAKVQERAENLQVGMDTYNVLMILGSPAEYSADRNTWIYLPERPGVLVPSRALHLTFENNVLIKYGYRAIVLGQDL